MVRLHNYAVELCRPDLTKPGVIPPSPACARALQTTVSALQAAGHTVIPVTPPSPYTGLLIASTLLTADGCSAFHSLLRTGESSDPGAAQLSRWASLPRPVRYLWYLWTRYVRRDPLWADLLRHSCGPLSVPEQWTWVGRREIYRAEWHAWWDRADVRLDFLLTPPNATPAVPHRGMRHAVSSCGYTFLFNVLDYACGIVPVTRVDGQRDALPPGFALARLNGLARGAYGLYDARRMHGLPVGVQVVGRRLQEERVLGYMGRVEDALERYGESGKYQLMEIE